MDVNAVFEDVKIYKVQDRLDVVQGQSFTLEVSGDESESLIVFTNNDPVLKLDGNKVTASELGESRIRYMAGTSVVKDIDIFVVNDTHPNATTLNATLGEPVQK